MKKYFVEYGCYLEKLEYIVSTDMSRKELDTMVYEMARECTEGWLGMHGFHCDCFDEDTEEVTYGECCSDTVEDACYYISTEYDEDVHGGCGHEEVTW